MHAARRQPPSAHTSRCRSHPAHSHAGKRTLAGLFQFVSTFPASPAQNPTLANGLFENRAVVAGLARNPTVPLHARWMSTMRRIGLAAKARIVADEKRIAVGLKPKGMVRSEHSSAAPGVALSPECGR